MALSVKKVIAISIRAAVLFQIFGLVLSEETCTDKVACNLYASEICSDPQYYQWATNNCAKHCGFCTSTTVSHVGVGKFMDSDAGSSTCFDTNANCAKYGTTLCNDVKFFSWVDENCRKHCNRCDTSCHDTISNCAEYGTDVCTELTYYNWVEMHCRMYCARCTP